MYSSLKCSSLGDQDCYPHTAQCWVYAAHEYPKYVIESGTDWTTPASSP